MLVTCDASSNIVDDHFPEFGRMVKIGSNTNYRMKKYQVILILKCNVFDFKVQILHFKIVFLQKKWYNINRLLRTVKTRMNEMQEKGFIVRKNGKKSGEWIVL